METTELSAPDFRIFAQLQHHVLGPQKTGKHKFEFLHYLQQSKVYTQKQNKNFESSFTDEPVYFFQVRRSNLIMGI